MTPTIAIRDWRNEIVVPRDHPAPERVRDDIDGTSPHIATALAEGMSAYVGRKAGQVILIRDLVFDCNVDMRCDRRTLARALAYRCGIALTHAIESSGSGVVRFASRAAFVARFVEDVASGRAWGQWYYASFEGIRVLPSSAAIRSALVDDPATGRAALALIPRAAWPALARTLGSDDAARILDALAPVKDAPHEAISEARWIAALGAAPTATTPAPPHVIALMLYAHALLDAGPGNGADAFAALTLAAMLAMVRGEHRSAVEALQRGDLTELARFEPAVASVLAPHFGGSHTQALRSLVREARSALAPGRTSAAKPGNESKRLAPFAGLGLLLGEIDGLLDDMIVTAFAPLKSFPVRGLAALGALAFAAGGEHAHFVWHDPSWREFLDIDRALQWSEYANALAAAEPRVARDALDALAKAAASHLRGERVATAVRADRVSLGCDVDASNGLWLQLRTRNRGREHRQMDVSHAFGARLAAARRARADWRALDTGAFGAALRIDWRLFFAAFAQVALRRLAQRVPGLRNASLPYLRANLIDAGGESSRLAPHHWCWRVKRPPLHVLLTLSGIARSEQVWRGPPDRRTIEWEWV